VLEFKGREFVKSVHIQSLLANYERIDKDTYEQLKRDCLRKFADFPSRQAISPNGKLQTIILRIMPYFIRKAGDWEETVH